MNIYHEVGHLLDNIPGKKDVFTNAVKNEDNPSWVANNIINSKALIEYPFVTDDLNYSYVQALQTYTGQGSSEQWADAFANYAAGNIKLSDPTGPGTAMNDFISGALAPYFGVR